MTTVQTLNPGAKIVQGIKNINSVNFQLVKNSQKRTETIFMNLKNKQQ